MNGSECFAPHSPLWIDFLWVIFSEINSWISQMFYLFFSCLLNTVKQELCTRMYHTETKISGSKCSRFSVMNQSHGSLHSLHLCRGWLPHVGSSVQRRFECLFPQECVDPAVTPRGAVFLANQLIGLSIGSEVLCAKWLSPRAAVVAPCVTLLPVLSHPV